MIILMLTRRMAGAVSLTDSLNLRPATGLAMAFHGNSGAYGRSFGGGRQLNSPAQLTHPFVHSSHTDARRADPISFRVPQVVGNPFTAIANLQNSQAIPNAQVHGSCETPRVTMNVC